MKWIDDGLREVRDFRRKPLSKRIQRVEDNVSPKEALKEATPQADQRSTQQATGNSAEKKPSGNSLLYDIQINKEDFTDEQYDYIKTLQKALSDPKSMKFRDVDSLVKAIGLTPEERQLMESEVRTMEKAPQTAKGSKENYVMVERLERLMKEDPSLVSVYDAWWKSVEQAVGKVNSRSELTPEQWKKIPPPPPKLEAMIEYIMPK